MYSSRTVHRWWNPYCFRHTLGPNAARVELHGQGTQVVAVYPGIIDTEMASDVQGTKIAPEDVVARMLDAVEQNLPEVIAGEWAQHVKSSVRMDQSEIYPSVQRVWDAGGSPWARA